jgi:exosortase A-associated hydrolase 2
MEPFFLDTERGRRFCIYHPAVGVSPPRAAMLYLHPFAEELNRSRRMAALQARLLAAEGYAVLQCDLFGCGDSDGDFGEATWAQWLADVDAALAWLRTHVAAPLWLWGLRAGCLLAADALPRHRDIAGLLFWQPQTSGKLALKQFLRIKMAERMLDGVQGEGTDKLRARLLAGEGVEIAGYLLAPGMAEGLEAASLRLPGQTLRIECLEVAAGDGGVPTPAVAACVAQWQAAGHAPRATSVGGASFWQMAEPEDAPALLRATSLALAPSPD